LKEVSRSFSQT